MRTLNVRRSIAGSAAATIALLLTSATAYAGDATAHTSAAVIAAWIVSNLPEFSNGVGSPRFSIPTGDFDEAFCPYEILPTFDDGSCAYSDPNGFAINEPDDWSCLDLRQPPAISALNSSVSLSETVLATILAKVGGTMACNWNHFVNNPSLGDRFSAAATAALTRQWADEIPTSIERNDGVWSCSVTDWKTYYRRVVNGLHYVQDMQTEHHLLGNQNCSEADIVPGQTFDQMFTFDGARSCSNFLDGTSQQSQSLGIACDYEVILPIDILGTSLNPQMQAMSFLCNNGVPLACMGFERVLRHHCNVPEAGITKSITCSGPPGDHLLSTNTLQYCEGELYNFGGGQDFVGPAAIASVSVLIDAARRWAAVCRDPPGSGLPDPPGNVGASAGDPHLCTFDRVRYDFQAYGECTLVQDADDGLEIQTRMHPWRDSSKVAINVGVAAHIANDVVDLYSGGRVTLNHVDVTFADGKNVLPGGGVVWRSGQAYALVWPDNTQLRLGIGGEYLSPQIFLPDSRRGRVSGPLGNLDGATAGELVTRQGVVLPAGPVSFETFHNVYVESWRVGNTSLFDYPAQQGTEDFTDRSFPPQLATTASLADADRQTATAACQAAQVAPEWLDSCLMDVGFTGDRRFAGDLAVLPRPVASVDISPPAGGGTGGVGGSGGTGGAGGGAGGTGGNQPRVAIPGLFTTGVDDNGVALPSGANDLHYQITDIPQSAVVIDPGNGAWLPNTTAYHWVWQTANGTPVNVTRTFRTTFSLSGLNPATAAITGTWATDNIGVGIVLNGHDLGMPNPTEFQSFTTFSVAAGSELFVAGTNTLDFTVTDVGTVAGFLVGGLAGTAQVASAAP